MSPYVLIGDRCWTNPFQKVPSSRDLNSLLREFMQSSPLQGIPFARLRCFENAFPPASTRVTPRAKVDMNQ